MPAGMTVEQYVLLGRSPHLRPLAAEGEADFEAVDTALSRLHLTKLARRTLETLSGGERQRTSLARALAQQPRLLLLDEPSASLDVGHQQEVLELIDEQRLDLGITVVSTMHDLTLAAQYGDHIVLLAGGRVVASGPPVQVLTGPHIRAHYGAHVDVIRPRRPPRRRPHPHPDEGGRTRCPNVTPPTSPPTTPAPTTSAVPPRSCSSTPGRARGRRPPPWAW